ncbi:hypothetical protein C8A03DRAFT_36313 [Achaetomium macrosporum]|uniref:MHYT domain-containing protein n=1 Tax=Achaetomium macrosporum TaxID=79813 RepID=A0AAN7HCC9_9PEZI|nr:hypothetical protein C8A03DRAFT_36313 [Achaetomium macrosporum]
METALKGRDSGQYLGQVVPFTIDPGLLVLSYAVSLVGAAATLELIHRRTSRRGYYNNILLLCAAITMGGVAIWSMHFIGNLATTLLHSEPELHVVYSGRVTVASFFVPIIVLLVAFFVVTGASGNGGRVSWWRVCASGALAGGAICGMHYLGNASVSNYRCDYRAAYVVGSAIIAVVASTAALALFFVIRSAWTNSWWKRTGCAVVLAGAVSGMHWCAVMGTKWTLIHLTSYSDIRSRNRTVIVTACLSLSACLVMAGLAIYSARVRKGYADRARTITLASAVFDEHGRVMVTPDGFLPSEVVTRTFLQKTQNATFSVAHPLFQWLFQASRSWTSIAPLLDKMNHHLASLPHHGRNVRTGIELVNKEGIIIDNYDTIFCELFCVAASALAQQMHEDLVEAGILWDEILTTGGHPTASFISQPSASTRSRDSVQDADDLAEKGSVLNKRNGNNHGHLMFLVRRVDSNHAGQLAASGYCFAEPRQVAQLIRSKMQIRTTNFEEKLHHMKGYARGVATLDPGVHVGLFAVRTKVHQTGFDVLVRSQARNLLPSVELPLDRLEPSHAEFLQRLDGMTLGALVRRLELADNAVSPRDANFAGLLLDAVQKLRGSIQNPVFDSAKFVGISQVPRTPPNNSTRPSTCALIAFTIIIPIHLRVHPSNTPAYEFIPLSFFKTQQLVHKNPSHNAAFARSVHRNIAPILDSVSSDRTVPSTSHLSRIVSMPSRLHFLRTGRLASRSYLPNQPRHRRTTSTKLVSPSREHMALTPSNASVSSLPLYSAQSAGEPEHTKAPSKAAEPNISKPPPLKMSSFGGIMISQEVTVHVQETGNTMIRNNSNNDTSNNTPPPELVLPIPPPARQPYSAASKRGVLLMQDVADAGNQIAPQFDQVMELRELSPLLGLGMSKVEVKKDDGDGAATTWVDALFARCLY